MNKGNKECMDEQPNDWLANQPNDQWPTTKLTNCRNDSLLTDQPPTLYHQLPTTHLHAYRLGKWLCKWVNDWQDNWITVWLTDVWTAWRDNWLNDWLQRGLNECPTNHISLKLTNHCLRLKRRTPKHFFLSWISSDSIFFYFFSICFFAGYYQRKEWGFCGSHCLPIPHGHTLSSNTTQILV